MHRFSKMYVRLSRKGMFCPERVPLSKKGYICPKRIPLSKKGTFFPKEYLCPERVPLSEKGTFWDSGIATKSGKCDRTKLSSIARVVTWLEWRFSLAGSYCSFRLKMPLTLAITTSVDTSLSVTFTGEYNATHHDHHCRTTVNSRNRTDFARYVKRAYVDLRKHAQVRTIFAYIPFAPGVGYTAASSVFQFFSRSRA